MYTELSKRNPGKLEGCGSQLIGEVLLNLVGNGFTDEEVGDCSEFGEWLGLIKGKRFWFIVREDDYGFFDYTVGKPEEIEAEWEVLAGQFDEEV